MDVYAHRVCVHLCVSASIVFARLPYKPKNRQQQKCVNKSINKLNHSLASNTDASMPIHFHSDEQSTQCADVFAFVKPKKIKNKNSKPALLCEQRE